MGKWASEQERQSALGVLGVWEFKERIPSLYKLLTPLKTFTLWALILALSVTVVHAQDQLVLLSPHWEGIRIEFDEAFREQYKQDTGRDVDLKWLDVGGTSDILKFIRSEFKNKASGIRIDLFFGGGTEPYTELKKLGLLERYRVPDEILGKLAPTIGGVPLYDTDYSWYAVTMAGFGIIYNKVVLKRLGLPEPKTWEDLARPELFTWVASADPGKSGSVHMAYEIILQAYGWQRGWQIIIALGANVRGFSGYASRTPKDVAVGEVAYGLAIDSHAWAQVKQAGADKIGYVMPHDLTVVNGDAIAILKGAPHRAIAERFIRFALSEEGQKLLMLRKGEPDGPQQFELGKFSVIPGLYSRVKGRTSVRLNPFEWKSNFVYDATKGSGRWGIVNDLMGAWIIDPHDRLAATWKRAIKAGEVEAELQRLATIPVSEQEVQSLIDTGRWRNVEFRNRTINAWASMARETYRTDENEMSLLSNLPALIALIVAIAMVVYMRRRFRAS